MPKKNDIEAALRYDSMSIFSIYRNITSQRQGVKYITMTTIQKNPPCLPLYGVLVIFLSLATQYRFTKLWEDRNLLHEIITNGNLSENALKFEEQNDYKRQQKLSYCRDGPRCVVQFEFSLLSAVISICTYVLSNLW